MKLTTTLLVSIVAAAASDDSKMIRGGGLVATAADDETHATHNVLRSVNFYEAAAQGDFEDIPPHNGDETVVPSNPCPACEIVGEGHHEFCGMLGVTPFVSPCVNINKCSQNGFACEQCSFIAGHSGNVGGGAYRCVASPSFDENA